MIVPQPGARISAALIACLIVAAPTAQGQTTEAIGSRALGMAGAFVAVADDATAAYWNPAGLATGAVLSLLVERQTLALHPDNSRAPSGAQDASGFIAGLGTPPLGLSYYRLRSSRLVQRAAATATSEDDRNDREVELTSLVTHHAAVALLHSLGDHIVMGTTLKYIRGVAADHVTSERADPDALLDRAGSLSGTAGSAWDADVGLMISFDRARVGLVARNLREPEFDTPGGGRLGLERQVRAGLAVLPAGGLTVAADIDLVTQEGGGGRREVAFGVERWLGEIAGLRGGFRVNLEGDTSPVGSLGASMALLRFLWVDAQVTRGQGDSERGWGLGFRLGF